jgi:hypothetical protein
LIDLGSVAAPGVVEIALEDALRRRLTTLPRLEHALIEEGGRGRRGAAVLGGLLRTWDRSRPTDCELERLLLPIFRRGGFPPPRCQHRVLLPDGSTARLDFAYPEAMIGVEADSYRWHTGREAWSHDRTRLNALVSIGWRILHATWVDIQNGGDELIDALRRAFGQQRLL